ncbi:MAG TPA: tRNA dihydrouridine synthase DusB [Firmicutes bacterium]|nr:tRNA dihydrouridine synthase DusB [Bacillota bacterium]
MEEVSGSLRYGRQIGRVELQAGAVLAPMAGFTDTPFRLLCKRYGAALVYGQLVSVKSIIYGNCRAAELLDFLPEEKPIAVQLFGAEPREMATAIKMITNQMAPDHLPDIIDINMGCPVPKVVNSGAGCALMRDPGLAAAMVAAAAEATAIPVTVKMRSGWDAQHINAPELAKLVEMAGAQAVTVHARTREQFYSGRADWSIIKEVKAAVDIPVIGNGDVDSPDSFAQMLAVTRCDAVMVGRAALGRPWLFAELSPSRRDSFSPPQPVEVIALAIEHLKAALRYHGPEALYKMRKHLAFYLKGLRGSHRIKAALLQASNEEQALSLLTEYQKYLAGLEQNG